MLPDSRCTTLWFSACTADTSTPQRFAAACSSIMRIAAPHWRIGCTKCRVLREPSVSWLPYFFSSPGACCTRTCDQSASISSATTMGRLVRTPVPISERLVMMVTRPDGSIATKTCGSLTVPPGILPAPVAQSARALAGSRLTPTISVPVAKTPCIRERRLTLTNVADCSRPAVRTCGSWLTLPRRRGGSPRRCAGSSRSDRCCRPSP